MAFLELPGLLSQVQQGAVEYVSLYVGANDFYHFAALKTLSHGHAAQPVTNTMLQDGLATAESNDSQVVQAVLSASPSVKLVVVTLPPVTFLPLAQRASANPLAAPLLEAIDNVIAQYDRWLTELAAGNPRIALADFAGVTDQLAAQAGQSGTIDYGGTLISLTHSGDAASHFFLADQAHLGTVGQGMLANTILNALDARFGADIAPLSPQEVVGFARHVRPSTP